MSERPVAKRPSTTAEWAASFGISTAETPPAIANYREPIGRTPRDVATRALVLQCVVAVACDVDPIPVAEWMCGQRLWDAASPAEQAFLNDPASATPIARNGFRWRQEAEWALLWAVGKVDRLGLPTAECDTRQLVDEVVPPLGSDVEPFLASAIHRSPGERLAEEDRYYDLWCRYIQSRKTGPEAVPADLLVGVLYQREYAFEWLIGDEPWDEVQCDA